jgi:hypothetical protein
MILPNLSKWNYTKDLAGLLFFAQRLCELLYDKTLDSYKAPSLNSHINTLELRLLANRFLTKKIPHSSIMFSLDELADRIKEEIVFTPIERERYCYYLEQAKQSVDQPQVFYEYIRTLSAEVSSQFYHKTKEKLISLVFSPNKKTEIEKITINFTTELQALGYHKGYMFAKARKFFFSKKVIPSSIDKPDVIHDFLKLFDEQENEYKVVFKGDKLPISTTSLAERFNIIITDSVDEELGSARLFDSFDKEITDSKIYYIVNGIEALDPHSAREQASMHLDFFINVCQFHNHSAIFYYNNCGYVYNTRKKMGYSIAAPLKAMECGVLNRQPEKDMSINTNIDILSRKYFFPSDRNRFIKIMDYHHAALKNTSPENQLVSLWASLEGFLPDPPERSSRIQHYVNLLLPVLSLTYNEKIISNLVTDLENAGDCIAQHIHASKSGNNFFEKSTHIILCPEMKEWRLELYSLLDRHPLLVNRCYNINKAYSCSKSILQVLNKHKTKIERHIKRIYSTRNQIMHDAESFPYIKSLVENLHDYIDILIVTTGAVGRHCNDLITISDSLRIITRREQEYEKLLSRTNTPISLTNCFDFVFGEDNILATLNSDR